MSALTSTVKVPKHNDLKIPVSAVCNVIMKFHIYKTVKRLLGCSSKKKIKDRSLSRLMQIVEKKQKNLQAILRVLA